MVDDGLQPWMACVGLVELRAGRFQLLLIGMIVWVV
jgi:hypothetical protein